MRQIELVQTSEKCKSLLNEATTLMASSDNEDIKVLLSRIPAEAVSIEEKPVLVFAGQYSAGKSTILRVLTGREDIETGAGITTQVAHRFEWNETIVVDTPGVHTQLRPDHDDISYKAIAKADLLVFVVTNELFDDDMANHFRKLAIDRDKGHEILLVVNKMRRCHNGNSAEAQEIKRDDLRKVLGPKLTPEGLRTSFIDANAALESKSETDEELAGILLKKSGMDQFIENLNSFVRDKGIMGKYTSSLYELEQVLQEALTCESKSTGDTDLHVLEELLLQRRRALIEVQERMIRSVEADIQKVSVMIRQEGNKTADILTPSADVKNVNTEIEAAQARVEVYAKELEGKVQKTINKHLEELNKKVYDIFNSEIAKALVSRLVRLTIDPKLVSNIKNASGVSSRLGEMLVKNSFDSKAASSTWSFRTSPYSGTPTHEAVLAVGKFFGKSFKPWEAVKWTRTIANAGRVLSVAGTVLTVILQVKEDMDMDKREKGLQEGRSALRSGFNDAAYAIESYFGKSANECVESFVSKELKDVDDKLKELRDTKEAATELFRNISRLRDEVCNVIREIHSYSVPLA